MSNTKKFKIEEDAQMFTPSHEYMRVGYITGELEGDIERFIEEDVSEYKGREIVTKVKEKALGDYKKAIESSRLNVVYNHVDLLDDFVESADGNYEKYIKYEIYHNTPSDGKIIKISGGVVIKCKKGSLTSNDWGSGSISIEHINDKKELTKDEKQVLLSYIGEIITDSYIGDEDVTTYLDRVYSNIVSAKDALEYKNKYSPKLQRIKEKAQGKKAEEYLLKTVEDYRYDQVLLSESEYIKNGKKQGVGEDKLRLDYSKYVTECHTREVMSFGRLKAEGDVTEKDIQKALGYEVQQGKDKDKLEDALEDYKDEKMYVVREYSEQYDGVEYIETYEGMQKGTLNDAMESVSFVLNSARCLRVEILLRAIKNLEAYKKEVEDEVKTRLKAVTLSNVLKRDIDNSIAKLKEEYKGLTNTTKITTKANEYEIQIVKVIEEQEKAIREEVEEAIEKVGSKEISYGIEGDSLIIVYERGGYKKEIQIRLKVIGKVTSIPSMDIKVIESGKQEIEGIKTLLSDLSNLTGVYEGKVYEIYPQGLKEGTLVEISTKLKDRYVDLLVRDLNNLGDDFKKIQRGIVEIEEQEGKEALKGYKNDIMAQVNKVKGIVEKLTNQEGIKVTKIKSYEVSVIENVINILENIWKQAGISTMDITSGKVYRVEGRDGNCTIRLTSEDKEIEISNATASGVKVRVQDKDGKDSIKGTKGLKLFGRYEF